MPTNHFAFADGLRALAILFVVLNHFALFGDLTIHGHKNDLAFLGRWGVNCFFLLSGFLLSRSFLKTIFDPTLRFPSVRSYLLRRFYRIYPLYALAVVISGCIGAYVTGRSPLAFIGIHLPFAQFLFVDQINSGFNAPLWTMAIDVQFYLALPLAALIALRMLAGRTRAQKRIALFGGLAALSAASLVYRYLAFKHVPVAQGDFDVALVYVRNVLGMLPAFALGVALSIAQLEFELKPHRGAAVFAILAGIGIFMTLGALKSGGSSLTVKVIADLFAALSAGAIFFGAWLIDAGPLTRFASSRFVTEAAALAYGIYLFHWPLLTVVVKVLPARGGSPLQLAVMSAFGIVLIVPAAYAAHRFVESPFLSANERLRRSAS